ncbi:hypothetical protein [Leptolyngbya ohadii]|nr:hypothetical protein [Leptolyngbya ohadii]
MRILLVEDDAAQLEPLQAALSEVGHIVDGSAGRGDRTMDADAAGV